MQKALQPVDITHLPDLLSLAEEVRNSGEPRLLKRGDEEVALLTPVRPRRAPRQPSRRRARRADSDDPFANIIGIGDSAGSSDDPIDVSENKYKYLADAYISPPP